MHVKFTIPAAQDFVSQGWQLLIEVSTMEGDGKFVLESVGFSTCLKLTCIDDEVVGIECEIPVFELNFTLNNDGIKDGGALVYKQCHTFRHVY